MIPSTASPAPPTTGLPTLLTILRSGKKPENVWFRIYYGAATPIVWIALRLRWTPNQLTIAGALLNFAGFLFLMMSSDDRRSVVIAYLVLNVAHIFDCADGQLAYVANMRSELGYWFDSSLDVFKCAFSALLLIKLIDTFDAGYTPRWLNEVAVCAIFGHMVNYALTLHALRYREINDGYLKNSLEKSLVAKGVKRYLATAALSHLREYGNLLLVLLLFAIDRRVALWSAIVLGSSHWIFALRRVLIVGRRLETR